MGDETIVQDLSGATVGRYANGLRSVEKVVADCCRLIRRFAFTGFAALLR
jgi:hypothetical protein